MRSRPLEGVRVLVGRARRQASALSAGLKALGAQVVEIPFIEIRPPRSYKPLDDALRNIREYDWLILTSVNGVQALAARMMRLRMNPQALKRLQIAAIGPATRDAITDLGLRVAVVPKNYVAESVVESVRRRVKGKKVLLARATVARDVIPRELRTMGASVDVAVAYKTVIPKGSRTRLQTLIRNPESRPHVVCFTSSSTVKHFAELLGREKSRRRLQGVKFASIGPITSATLRECGFPVHMEAEEYTIPGLIRIIKEVMRARSGKRPAMPSKAKGAPVKRAFSLACI